MPAAQLIVCERSNRWTVAMRWALADSGVRVQPAGWDECRRALDRSPATVLGLELRLDNLEETVARLLAWRREEMAAPALVFGSRQLRAANALLYEAGAVFVVDSTRNLDATSRLVRRLAANPRRGPQSYRETIRQRIPW